jgi:hypothetical protein
MVYFTVYFPAILSLIDLLILIGAFSYMIPLIDAFSYMVSSVTVRKEIY